MTNFQLFQDYIFKSEEDERAKTVSNQLHQALTEAQSQRIKLTIQHKTNK